MSERPGLSRNVSAARSRHRLRLGPDGRNFGRGGKRLPPGACALRGRAPESRTFRARDANGREASEPSPHIGLRGYRTRRGNGIIALLKNGPGPTVMLRTELDALPVEEKTGLPYA